MSLPARKVVKLTDHIISDTTSQPIYGYVLTSNKSDHHMSFIILNIK